MHLLPDPAELDAIAARIGMHGRTLSAHTHTLALSVAATHWQGVAADTFDLAADDTLAVLRSAAGQLEDAAAALHWHAQAVRHVLDQLRGLAASSLGTLNSLTDAMRDGLLDPAQLPADAARTLHAVGGLAGHLGRLTGDLVGVG